jgi:uncharacterized protein
VKITVLVKPGSKHKEGVEEKDGVYVVYVKAPAVDGKANEAAVAVLAEHFSTTKANVCLVHGATSRKKIFDIPATRETEEHR